MAKNLGTVDRVTRGLGGAALTTCAWMAPLPPEVRLPVFGLAGAYLLFNAISGSCLGYKLMGKSTCPTR